MKFLKKVQSLPTELEEGVLYYNETDGRITIKKNGEDPEPELSYTIKVSANGDGYIVVNQGMGVDNAIITLQGQTITMPKLPSDQDIEVDGVMYYAYDFMGGFLFLTQSEEGTYENALLYQYDGENMYEIEIDALVIHKSKEDDSKEQTLYYTEGENQILSADTPILSVSTFENMSEHEGNNTLTAIEIPYGVTSIGTYAFYYCSSLTSVTIPNSVTSIGHVSFQYCSGLTSITIPDSVTSIGNDAFQYCSNLTSITIPNSITSIGSYAFQYCSGLTSVTIGTGVTSIDIYTFSFCSSLASVNIPNSVTSIGNDAFAYCSGLTSVIIPDSVTSIGKWAFHDCSSLTSVTIPDSVTSIGKEAFLECSSLSSITYKGTEYTSKSALYTALTNNGVTIGSAAFNDTALTD